MTQIPTADQGPPMLGEARRLGARICAWLASARTHERPTGNDLDLARYRRMARGFDPTDLTAEIERGRADDFGLTDADVFGALGGEPRRTRFLDYYSQYGLELILESSGMLDRLRAQGFEPWLEMDLDGPVGDTLRLFGSAGRGELLAELRAARDRVALRGFDMLHVEWLTLRKPRSGFAADRPALPGQSHPGLGLLREIATLLVLVCDRLGLDGLHFVPSHYHVAAQSRVHLRFVHSEDEARFRAMREALGDLPLGEASRAVAAGRVREERGQAVEWRPVPMVLPVSARLSTRAQRDEAQLEVARPLRFWLATPGGSS